MLKTEVRGGPLQPTSTWVHHFGNVTSYIQMSFRSKHVAIFSYASAIEKIVTNAFSFWHVTQKCISTHTVVTSGQTYLEPVLSCFVLRKI